MFHFHYLLVAHADVFQSGALQSHAELDDRVSLWRVK